MISKKTVFISDIHLGPGFKTDYFIKDKHTNQLLSFLDYIIENAASIKDLVLLGDIFEMWVCPMDDKPAVFEDVFANHREFFIKLGECVDLLDHVFFINGNHDMHICQKDLDSIGSGSKKIIKINRYNSGLLHAEHGNRFAIFNAEDKIHDPVHSYPLGYYLSRMMAGEETYVSRGIIFTVLDDILEVCLTAQSFSESVLEAIQEYLGLSPDSMFIMPGERRPVSIGEISRKYSDLFDNWVNKFGYFYTLEAIKGELRRLGWFADRICKKEGYKVVVFGHTHRPEIDKDSILVKNDRIYANTGYWCTEKPSFVEVTKSNSKYEVTLKAMINNQITTLDCQKV